MRPSATWVSRVRPPLQRRVSAAPSRSDGVTRTAPSVRRQTELPPWAPYVFHDVADPWQCRGGIGHVQRAGPEPLAGLHRARELFPLARGQGPKRHGDPVRACRQDPLERRLDLGTATTVSTAPAARSASITSCQDSVTSRPGTDRRVR